MARARINVNPRWRHPTLKHIRAVPLLRDLPYDTAEAADQGLAKRNTEARQKIIFENNRMMRGVLLDRRTNQIIKKFKAAEAAGENIFVPEVTGTAREWAVAEILYALERIKKAQRRVSFLTRKTPVGEQKRIGHYTSNALTFPKISLQLALEKLSPEDFARLEQKRRPLTLAARVGGGLRP